MSKADELEHVAEVLDIAAEHMSLYGKCSGSFQDDEGRVCAVGAINIAVAQVLGAPAFKKESYGYTPLAIDEPLGKAAVAAVVDQLRNVHNVEEVFEWNDRLRRRKHDVIEVFNRAEAKLRDTAQALRDLDQA